MRPKFVSHHKIMTTQLHDMHMNNTKVLLQAVVSYLLINSIAVIYSRLVAMLVTFGYYKLSTNVNMVSSNICNFFGNYVFSY